MMTRHLQSLVETVRTSVFRPELAASVKTRLESSPWVTRVNRVERRLPNNLILHIDFRLPAGVVELAGRHYLVDREGYWLPEGLYSWPTEWDETRTPIITDSRLQGPPPRERPWNSASIPVGAHLAGFLREKGLFENLAIQSIDVSNVGRPGSEVDITLRTDSGADIRWGAADCYREIDGLRWSPLERTDRQKLEMLCTKLTDYPDMRGTDYEIEYIDLRTNKVFFKPRLPEGEGE